MDRTERFYRIDQLINERRLVRFDELLEALAVSPATLKRDLEYMRNRLNAPIVWDRDRGGYRFESGPQTGGQYELPGLWFSPREIHALLTMQHLLADLDPGGILTPHVQPLQARLNALLGSADDTAEEIRRRVLIIGMGRRTMKLDHFEQVGSALLRRKRMLIHYHTRSRGETNTREISPQRLVHYRDNWYLDAWCHWRRELRNFAIDSMRGAEVLEKPARDVPERTLNGVLGAGYGIFSGGPLRRARLRFTPERARWVAQETWHPRQKSRFSRDGSFLLELPYSDERELVMDILRHGPDVEVLAPDSLRAAVKDYLARTLGQYAEGAGSAAGKD